MSTTTAGAVLRQPQERHFFTEREWRTTEAITSRIFPSTDTAGARELGAVCFIDRMLVREYSQFQITWRDGLHQLDEVSARVFGREFENLTEREQDQLLSSIERCAVPEWGEASAFFEMVRLQTIEGVLSDPKYGGNRHGLGWSGLV
jgi:gluconate 2-dehydrogenase gamma chain